MHPERVIFCLALAACSASNPDAAVMTTSDGGTTPSKTPDSIAIDAGGDASSDAGDGGPKDAGTDALPIYLPGATLCNPKMKLDEGDVVETGALLASVTPDELTIAWLDGDVLSIADRDHASDPFGDARVVPGSFQGASLTPDGLVLVTTDPSARSILRFERADRASDFVQEVTTAYDALTNGLGTGETVADPVLAYGEQVLVYSVFGGSTTDTVRLASRISTSADFTSAVALAFPELRRQGSGRRRPTGIGSDFQTLFFWDEVSATEKLGRLEGTIGFFEVNDLGPRRAAQPNADCTRLYFSNGSSITAAGAK